MRALLDVNMLVSLLDPEHAHHLRARAWWDENHGQGWASCPLTQSGLLRVISSQLYPRSLSMVRAFGVLQKQLLVPGHEFWAEDISIADPAIFDHRHMVGRNQITDCYLLAVAVKHEGRLVTLDQRIVRIAVRGAGPDNLVIL
jgi:uncharacterized protein